MTMENDREKFEHLRDQCLDFAKNGNVDGIIHELCNSVKYTLCNISTQSMAKLLRIGRETLFPHTTSRSFCLEWDMYAAYALIYCVFPGALMESWERIIRELYNDFNISPFDGTDGAVLNIVQAINKIYDIVAENDHVALRVAIHRRKLQFPVIHIVDENNWTLLHYAAYHSAIESLELLVGEGISLSSVSSSGQTPLHVAASALRYDAISALARLGGPAVKVMRDMKDMTPLMSMLDTMRSCHWNRKLSSQQLLKCIHSLMLSELDVWNVADNAEHSLLDNHLSVFSVCVAYTDTFVATKIIQSAHVSLKDLIGRVIVREDATSSLETHVKGILCDIKKTILLVITRKRSRILSVLIDTFKEYFLPSSQFVHLHVAVKYVSNFTGWKAQCCDNSHSAEGPIGHEAMVLFWQQCMFLATMSKSLRLVSVLSHHCSQSLAWMSNSRDITKVYLEEPFLVVPVCRGDVTMVRSMLVGFEKHAQLPLWVSTPLRFANGSVTSARTEFLAWCGTAVLKSVDALVPLSHRLFSPLAIACLTGNTYMLQTLLKYHWTPTHVIEAVSISARPLSGVFGGVNPLVCCVLSGSKSCAAIMLEHFGNDIFKLLCNDGCDYNVLPLQAALWILRVQLSKRLFRDPSLVQSSVHTDKALYEAMYFGYTSIVFDLDNLCALIKMILPWSDPQHSVHTRPDSGDAESWRVNIVNELETYKEQLQSTCPSADFAVISDSDSESTPKSFIQDVRKVSLGWKSLAAKVHSPSFVISLKVLMRSAQTSKGNSSFRTNKYLVNLCRAVVLVLDWHSAIDGKDVDPSTTRQKDCWNRLNSYTGHDFGVPTSNRCQSIHHSEVSLSRKRCRLGSALMALKGQNVSREVLDAVFNLFPDAIDKGDGLGSFSMPLKSQLPTRSSNCYDEVTIAFSVGVLYEWLIQVMQENRIVLEIGRSAFARLEAMDEIEAVDYAISNVKERAKQPSNLMHMIGEQLVPLDMDMIVCTASALFRESVYNGVISSSSVKPCQYNDWQMSKDDELVNGSATDGMETDEGEVAKCDSSHAKRRSELPLMSDCWENRSNRGQSLRGTTDIRLLCEEVAKLMIEDGRELFLSHDSLGLSPLLSLCSYGLWAAAELLLPYLSREYDTKKQGAGSSDKVDGLSKCSILFLGGLQAFNYLTIGHSGINNNRHMGAVIRRRLHWTLDEFKAGGVCWVSVGSLCVYRHCEDFVKKCFSHFPVSDLRCTMALSLLCDSPNLCTELALLGARDLVEANIANTTLVSSTYCIDSEVSNHRLANVIDDISVYDIGSKKVTTGYALSHGRTTPFYVSLISARLVLAVVVSKCICENIKLRAAQSVRASENGRISDMQILQQRAIKQYGFFPQYQGPLAGLCLARGDKVWMMNGSLLKFDVFFSDIKYLQCCLPVPRSSQRRGFSTGYTALHALVATASQLPKDVVHHLLERFSAPISLSNALTPDIQGRSPVYLALHCGDVNLASSLVTEYSGTTGPSLSTKGGIPRNDCCCIGSLYTRFASDNLSRLEDTLRDTLQGDFVNGRSGALLHLLSLNLDRVEMLWHILTQKCNIGALAKMMYDPAGRIVDCFQQAKVAMLLLNIPFSQISEKNSQYYSRQDTSNTPSELHPDKENHENSWYISNCKDPTPDKLRKLISWKTAMEIKNNLKEWVAYHLRAHRESRHCTHMSRNPSFCEVVLSEHKFSGAFGGVSDTHVHDAVRVGLESSVLLFKATDVSLVRFGSEHRHTNEDNSVMKKDPTIWGSTVPPLLLAETRRHRGRGVEGVHNMARLLSTFKNNSDLINDALKCAMVVLEFAKSICNARILVSLSHQPYPSNECTVSISRNLPVLGSKSVPTKETRPARLSDEAATEHHPIDVLRAQVKSAKKYSTGLYEQFSQYGNSIEEIDAALYNHLVKIGPRYIVANDEISESGLAIFIAIGSEVSPTFSKLRVIIIDALIVLVGIKAENSQLNTKESNMTILKNILHQYKYENSYDENEILTGSRESSSEYEFDERTMLNGEDFRVLVKSLSAMLKSMRTEEIAFMAISTENVAEGNSAKTKAEGGLIGLIRELCDHVKAYSDVFNQQPSVQVQKSALSMVNPGDVSVLLRNCPCSFERKDLLKLVAFTSKKNKAADSHSLDLVDKYLSQLSEGYAVARKLVEVVLRIVGVLTMAHVYKADYLNWKGTSDCNPYLALCCVTHLSSYGIAEPSRYVADRQLENDLVLCMEKLQANINGFSDRHVDSLSPIPAVLAQSPIFSKHTALDFFITVCALRGRARLLRQAISALPTIVNDIYHKREVIDTMCLVWHVVWLSPAPSVSPIYVQYTSCLDDEGFLSDAEKTTDLNYEHYRHSAYEECILLLLSHGYLPDMPPGSALSVLDVASLKGMSRVVNALLGMNGLNHHFRPLTSLSCVHFMLLNDRIDSSALEKMLENCCDLSSAGDIVEFSSFIKEVSSDVALMDNTMREVSGLVNIQLPHSLSVFNEELLGFQDSIVLWTPLKVVCNTFKALRGMVARRPRMQCPLYTLFNNYTNEVNNLSAFDPAYEFRDYHQNDLVWTTFHVAMTCRSSSKFQSLWTYVTSKDGSDASTGLSEGYAALCCIPLDLLHYACYYDMSATLECLSQCESFTEMNSSAFFPPLNSSYTPLNVALRVGSHRCVRFLIEQQMSGDQGVSVNTAVLMSCVTLGCGGEPMAVILLDTLIKMHGADDANASRRQLVTSLGASVVTQSRFELERGETLLHACARRNYSDMCDKLLKIGVERSPLDGTGMTPIQISISLGHSKTTRVFGQFCIEESKAVRIIAHTFRLCLFRKRWNV